MTTQQMHIQVENIKCGGCEKSITKGLLTISGVSEIAIDRDQQRISVMADESLREAVIAKLKAMGYPQQGSVSGIHSGLAQAKSFVSCAIGRMS